VAKVLTPLAGLWPGARLQCMTLLMFVLLFLQNAKPEIRIPDLEQHMHNSINLERRAADRQPLQYDETLANLARAHSEDMAMRGYFKHVTPEGLTPMKRMQAAGYDQCRLIGENIHQNNLYSRTITEKKKTTYDWNSPEQIAAITMKEWMNSEGHRQNILEKNFTREGVGVAIATDDKVYITQLLCGETN
jgi:uncharacterized protein YkwD